MLKLKTMLLTIFSLVFLVAATFPSQAQKKDVKEKKVYTGRAVLWRAPNDIESRNLLLGAGGEAMRPDLSRVTFVARKRVAGPPNTRSVMAREMSGSPNSAKRHNPRQLRTTWYGPPVTTRNLLYWCRSWKLRAREHSRT